MESGFSGDQVGVGLETGRGGGWWSSGSLLCMVMVYTDVLGFVRREVGGSDLGV